MVNAFDPIKLRDYDRHRITGMANTAFGSSGPPERLAAAQQAAGINRRLATTDSFGPPVPSITPPAYMLTAPDAVAPAFKTAYQVAVSRKPPNSMAEMLELRIRRATRARAGRQRRSTTTTRTATMTSITILTLLIQNTTRRLNRRPV